MKAMEYFLELFGHLPRAGPGDNASTRKAFRMMTELPPAPRILDVGCGPGVQTVELAKISGGHIVALDNLPLMLERVHQAAVQAGLADQIEPCLQDMHEMEFEEGNFDIIWSEAAIYIMGFRRGLEKFRSFAKTGGCIAVSEVVWFKPNPPEELRKWWQQYPEIDTIETKLKIISDLEYREVEHFVLPDSAWTDAYYSPLERRIEEVEPTWAKVPEAMEVIREARLELDMFKKYHAFYGYCFFVMRK